MTEMTLPMEETKRANKRDKTNHDVVSIILLGVSLCAASAGDNPLAVVYTVSIASLGLQKQEEKVL